MNSPATKAFPIEIRYGWTIGDEALPVEPRYLAADTFPPNLIFEPDPKATSRKFLEFDMPLKLGEWSLICGDKLNLWFYCTFAYADFMQTRHDAGFCWRWRKPKSEKFAQASIKKIRAQTRNSYCLPREIVENRIVKFIKGTGNESQYERRPRPPKGRYI